MELVGIGSARYWTSIPPYLRGIIVKEWFSFVYFMIDQQIGHALPLHLSIFPRAKVILIPRVAN